MAAHAVSEEMIREYVRDTFDGVDIQLSHPGDGSPEIAWGDTFFIYDPDRTFEAAGRFPFATIVTKDYPDDDQCHLDREGVFRLNIGVGKETFRSVFGTADDHNARDIAQLDVLFPHPVYGRMHWLSVINPSASTFESLQPMLAEAYELAVERAARLRKP